MRVPGAADNRTIRLDATKLKDARRKLALSRERLIDVAKEKRICLSLATLKRAEAGEPVYLATAGSLAGLLAVTVAELLPAEAGGGQGGNGGGGGDVIAEQPTIAVMPLRVTDPDALHFAEGL